MQLFLMRHADAAAPGGGFTDETRPLTPGGEAQVRAVAGELRRRSIVPHAVITSPYKRARQTGAVLSEELGITVLEDSPLLASCGAPPKIEALVERFRPDTCLVLVGHQPDLGLLALALCGISVSFSTATIAAFDWSDPEEPRFLWAVAPDDLPYP